MAQRIVSWDWVKISWSDYWMIWPWSWIDLSFRHVTIIQECIAPHAKLPRLVSYQEKNWQEVSATKPIGFHSKQYYIAGANALERMQPDQIWFGAKINGSSWGWSIWQTYLIFPGSLYGVLPLILQPYARLFFFTMATPFVDSTITHNSARWVQFCTIWKMVGSTFDPLKFFFFWQHIVAESAMWGLFEMGLFSK